MSSGSGDGGAVSRIRAYARDEAGTDWLTGGTVRVTRVPARNAAHRETACDAMCLPKLCCEIRLQIAVWGSSQPRVALKRYDTTARLECRQKKPTASRTVGCGNPFP